MTYDYNNTDPIKIKVEDLTERERFLLKDSKTFCMYPWVHLHAFPTGKAYPCCMSEMKYPVGDCKQNTLAEIWNSTEQKKLRTHMMTETKSPACGRCYEQENSGFFSGRQSANKHFGHSIDRLANTSADGHLDKFEMTYWDIRFSNLCNLRCRSCGAIFSSQWYKDQVAIAGPLWELKNTALQYAGRTKTDMWEQLSEHLDYVEQIYFAGGEPLMMEEHYNILDELERRKRFDVRLIYNTNFTQIKLKDRLVFDYWKKFEKVSVGASLDAMGPRAEIIRKGSNWDTVVENRKKMMEVCPDVDFYISPTLSIMNAMHIPDFHRRWVIDGLIKPSDININLLQDPPHYRVDIATPKYKELLEKRFRHHLNWLEPIDPLRRGRVGFESAIKFMNATDNSSLLPKFWAVTNQMDALRGEKLKDVIPELLELQ